MPENTHAPAEAAPENKPDKKSDDKEKKLTAATDKPVVGPPHHPFRTFLAAIFGIIALGLIMATILVVWFNRTVTDTDTYVRTITPLSKQSDIQLFIADRVTEGIVKGSATEAGMLGVVPPAEVPGKDAAQLQQAAQDSVKKSVLQVIQSAKFQTLWYESNRNAHDMLMTQLASNKKEIALDFTPLVNGVLAELKTTELAPVVEQVVLPADIGKVNMTSAAIEPVARYYNWLQTATWTLVAAAAIAAGACILLSTHHIRTVRRILMGTGIMTLFLALLLQLPTWTQAKFGTSHQKVAVAVADVLFHDLKTILIVIGVTGIVLALVSKVISVILLKKPKTKTEKVEPKKA